MIVTRLVARYVPTRRAHTAGTEYWNRDRLYEIMDFGTYMYVLVCTEYIPVRNAENGTYRYVPVCTEFVQVL
jgi:hypothetical protein